MRRLLLATDFDGTVAPSGGAAGQTPWHPDAYELFRALEHRDDIWLAIISGRDPDELFDVTRNTHCYLVGSFGRHIRDRNGETLRDAPALQTRQAPWASIVLSAGGFVEWKRHGVAIHWQGPSADGVRQAATVAFTTWARSNGLRVQRNRLVCEAIVPGPGKLTALRYLCEQAAADRVIYAGDGTSDLAALRWAARRGHAVYVGRDRPSLLLQNIEVVASISRLWRRVRVLVR